MPGYDLSIPPGFKVTFSIVFGITRAVSATALLPASLPLASGMGIF